MKKILVPVLVSSFTIASIGYGAVVKRDTIADHTHILGSSDEIFHGGGLDACGGHWDRKKGTYHYHQKRC